MCQEIKKCIVLNERFEVATYTESKPLNWVIEKGIYNSITGNSFMLPNIKLKVSWAHGYYQGNQVLFKFNDVVIERIKPANYAIVAERINFYASLDESELVDHIEKWQKLEHSEIQTEITKFKSIKDELVSEINRLSADQSKLIKKIETLNKISLKSVELSETISSFLNN